MAAKLNLVNAIRKTRGSSPLSDERRERLKQSEGAMRTAAKRAGVFLNTSTLEVEIATTPSLVRPLLDVLTKEEFGTQLRNRLAEWKNNPVKIDTEQLMLMIGYVGKGRFANRLSEEAGGLEPPDYIKLAIEHVIDDD
jgi:putative ATP-dependent endonuclease of OLD family